MEQHCHPFCSRVVRETLFFSQAWHPSALQTSNSLCELSLAYWRLKLWILLAVFLWKKPLVVLFISFICFFLCFVCFGLFEFNLFQALTVHHCEIQTNPMGSIMLSGKYFTLHAVFLNQWTFQHLYIHTSPLVCDTVKCFIQVTLVDAHVPPAVVLGLSSLSVFGLWIII